MGFLALILNATGREQFVQASRHRAQRIATAYAQHIRYTTDPEGTQLVRSGKVLTAIGVTLTITGAALMFLAIARHERGWYLILTGLLVMDIFVVFLL